MTELYIRARGPPRALPGGAHRTFFRWEGNISKELFDSVPAELTRGPGCVHCSHAIKYQVSGPACQCKQYTILRVCSFIAKLNSLLSKATKCPAACSQVTPSASMLVRGVTVAST